MNNTVSAEHVVGPAPTADCFIGVDVGLDRIRTGVFGADLRLRGKIKLTTKLERGPLAVLSRVARSIRYAADECDIALEQIQSVGIGFPAWVDAKGGVVRASPVLGWENVAVIPALRGDSGASVVIGNVHNLGAMAIRKLEPALVNSPDPLAVIFVAPQICAAVVRNGHWVEFGSEAWARDRFEAPHSNLFRTLAHAKYGRYRTRDFRQALRNGESAARDFILEMARVAGELACELHARFQPGSIVLSGGVLEEMGQEIRERVHWELRSRVTGSCEIPLPVVSTLGNVAGMTGAAVWATQGGQSLSAPSISAAVSSLSLTAALISSRSAVSNHS